MDSNEIDQIDARLRAAFAEPLPDAGALQNGVRRRIAAQRSLRLGMLAVAAGILLAVIGYGFLRRTTGIYQELALDHRIEVVERQPRHWRNGPAEIEPLVARYGVTAPMLAGFAPAGYHLLHAKSCGINGMPVLHLVYSNGNREISIYVRQHVGSGIRSGSFSVNSEQVVAFGRGGLEAAVVMVGSGEECQLFARRAASYL
jgi:anti-sigma factor RsiW